MKVFKFSAIALFADDVREEVGGTQTIVGIYPDNLAVPSFPGVIPKLAIYTRISFDPGFPPKNLTVSCSLDNGTEIASETVGADLVAQAVEQTKARGGPIATLISRAIIGGIGITSAGRIRAVVTHSGGEFLAGSINIALVEEEPAVA